MKNKKTLIFILSTLIFSFLLNIININPVKAANFSVSASKSKYSSTQNITISYKGSTSSKDWIGIYKAETTPSTEARDAALAYAYAPNSSGSVTFTPNDFKTYAYSPQKGTTLDQGTYKAVLLANDGYEVLAECNFQIDGKDPIYTFDVLSDSHIISSTNVNNNTLDSALKDIKNYSPNSSAIISNGDAVDQSDWNLYSKLRDIYYNNRVGLPYVYFNLGNHELFDTSANGGNYNLSSFDSKFKNYFLYFSKNIHHNLGKGTLASDTRTVPYYEEIINGNHFFFLASESVKGGDLADLSDTQLEWLDNKLWHIAQKKSPEPVFIFCHGALANTVAGSYSYQYTIENGIKKTWNGVLQDSKLRFILNKYPNVFYFSGHSHWNLSSANTMYQDKATYGGGIGATLFNGGSVTNLWSDNGGIAGGSQGLHIKVYEDKVVVKGRDYANKKWISDAVFTINLKDKYDSLNKIYKN